MPEVLELPPPAKTRKGAAAWTPDQAREMARRSHLPGSARFRKPDPNAYEPQPTAQAARLERLELLTEQITRTREALNKRLQPQHRAALLRALCDLLDQQRIARGEPLPGSLKPGGSSTRAPAWTEEPQAACGPGPTTAGSQAAIPPAVEPTSCDPSI